MSKIGKELMGASSIPLILSILQDGDTYGYDIMKRLKELSNGRIIWKEGSLYPVLKKMESLKYIKSYWDVKHFDRPRKYYKILAEGNDALVQSKEDWALMQNIFDTLWAKSLG
ncbi:MAG TPA: PadR family transcriptional regulator [Draconibacterium sp.]|nr:PadR family transcriptional regulator [Draconibacterium sp.]